MKKYLLKNLSACLPVGMAFIVTAILFSVNANAQIVYTDVIPDTTFSTNNGVYHLDLNNDGITDFNITYTTTAVIWTANKKNVYIKITPLGANKVGNDTTYPGALTPNSVINSSFFIWLGNANQILVEKIWHAMGASNPPLYYSVFTGNWNGVSNKYIPLQLDVNSQKYYGWVQLNVATGAASFTVLDYAYNSIPNQRILAGQTNATGIIENSFASSINLFPNPANNHVTIDLGNNNKKIIVTINDITGKIIYSTIATDTEKVEVNTEDFAEGIYIIQIQSAGFIVKKKLLIEK